MIISPFGGLPTQTPTTDSGRTQDPGNDGFSGQVTQEGGSDNAHNILKRVLMDLGKRIGRTPGDLRPLEELFNAPPKDTGPGDPGIRDVERVEPTTRKLVLWAPDIELPAVETDEADVDEGAKGAITGTFVEYLKDSEPRVTPVVHATANDAGAVLDGVLQSTADQEALVKAPPTPAAHTPPDVAEEGALALAEVDGVLSETAEQIPVAGETAEWESLYFAPMRAFATGHLDMRVTGGQTRPGSVSATSGAVSARPAAAAAAPVKAQAVQQAGNNASTRSAVEPAVSSSTPAAQQATESARAAAPRSVFYETIQAVLPPRQNFLLLEAGKEKRLFVRDYFSPDDTMRHLQSLARVAPFDLGELSVIINGKEHGRLG